MKTAVVYFSLEGNTRFAAKKAAELLQADLIELQPEKPYPTGAVSKFFWGGKSASLNEKPKLKAYEFNADAYDTVVLGTPLWAWKVTPPLRTFLTENDLSGKKVAVLISCGGGDTGKAFAGIKELVKQESLAAELKLVNPLQNREECIRAVEAFCKKLEQE